MVLRDDRINSLSCRPVKKSLLTHLYAKQTHVLHLTNTSLCGTRITIHRQDEIEGAKAARLMKNKEDINTQSTYHENDLKDTVSRYGIDTWKVSAHIVLLFSDFCSFSLLFLT